LTEEAKVNLRAYKYAGGDFGLMYVYFYNPVARWLVEKIPEWIAPNLITLAGFLFSAFPFVAIFVVFGTHFYNEEPKIPGWVFFAEAVCYFLYRMLDELDGKQARRTGNSSPLGLIFDHGCDAFAVGLQCMILAKLTQMGVGGILFVHGSNAIFHFATLEEYYVGGLFLPVGNAITDGSLLYFITMSIPGIFGNECFVAECFPHNYFYEGSPRLTAMNLILVFVVTVQSITVMISINNILKHKRLVAAASDDDYKALRPDMDGEELECGTLVTQILAYFFLQGSVQCLAFIGSEPFIFNDGKPGSVSSVFLLMVMQSFLMQHLTTEVMLCHLTKQKYVPTQNKLNVAMAAVSLIITAIWLVSPTFYEENIRMQTVLPLMLGLTFLCQWHFLLNTVSELACAL
jgi:phosphatidylglycerophosphate synthase